MNIYEGITPDQRWRNEMLKEQRETNRLLHELLDTKSKPAEVTEIKQKRPYTRRDHKEVVNQ